MTPASGPRFVSYLFAIVSSRSNGSLEEPNRRQALASQRPVSTEKSLSGPSFESQRAIISS